MLDYDMNVGRWIEDHPTYTLRIGFENYGYAARHRETGEECSALTLDELHELVTKVDQD